MGVSIGRWGALVMAVSAAGLLTACGADDDGGGGGGSSAATTADVASLEKCDTAPSEVTIGASLPLSGSGAPYGSVFSKSLQYGAKQINDAGGAGGKVQLRVKVLDDKAVAGTAVQNMRQLVNGDDVVAMVSGYNDPPLALAKVGQQDKIPVFNGGGNGTELAGNPYLWNNVSDIAQEAGRAYRYVKDEKDYKKVAILAATNYTAADIGKVEQTAKEVFGDDAVKVVKYDPELTDVKPQLQQIKAFGPDGIHLLNSGTLTINAAKNMSELKLGIPVIGTSGHLFEPGILKYDSMEGATAAAMAFEPPAAFAKEIEAATGVEANAFQDNYASIAKVIGESVGELVENGACVTGEAINTVVLQRATDGKGFEGMAGEVKYTPEGGSARELKILTVKDGEVAELEGGKPPA